MFAEVSREINVGCNANQALRTVVVLVTNFCIDHVVFQHTVAPEALSLKHKHLATGSIELKDGGL